MKLARGGAVAETGPNAAQEIAQLKQSYDKSSEHLKK